MDDSTFDARLRAVAPLLCVGFHGREVTPFARELLAAGGHAILFARNLGDAAAIRALTDELRGLATPAPLLLVDEEGGPVRRLRNVATRWPAAGDVGPRGEAEAEAFGRMLGAEVLAAGFNVDCAPVLDVATNPESPIIGARAFASDPDEAGRLALAFARGLEAAGIVAVGKHFPGHGDTSVDSHLTLPRVPHDLERLRAVELVPFRHAIDGGIPALMTAHVVYEGVDADLPATLSPRIVQDLLRDELGYDGLVITDDLEMGAIAERWPIEEVTRRALLAGADLLLICHDERKQQRALETAARLVEAGIVTPERLARSVARVRAVQARCTPPPAGPPALRVPEHVAWARTFPKTSGSAGGAGVE